MENFTPKTLWGLSALKTTDGKAIDDLQVYIALDTDAAPIVAAVEQAMTKNNIAIQRVDARELSGAGRSRTSL